ncbi:hypothetical protein EW026_g5053 [Hermanssonia centrifuga]|uniref:Uncharacterized protein n=1 Tax=Hermanssonia centrifuga TaxID=98765 RepID=A0A4V6S0X2_9APHY|nr:hypothetical protein EW026_g5053 [Hermanssonia centrifuga]
MSTRSDSLEECKDQDIPEKITVDSEVDLTAYYERNAGRLVVDPDEARVEFGEQVACRLKLTKDGTRVLWPQPSDDPEDPQNWSDFRKGIQLLIITLAAIVPDFDSGIGSWSIFLLGWGGILAVVLMRRYGRLPVLFWTQLLALGFLIGCAFAPNLNTFAGARMAKYRSGWKEVNSIWFKLIWRPHLFGILLFEAMLFGFSVGLNGTNIVFLEEQPPNGYGFTQFAIAGCYGTPVVAVLIGELLGRYLNDWIMNVCIRRNNGVFESESRLWACYVAVVLYIIGFILIGAAFQDHLNISCFIIGWGLVEIATMVNTVAVCYREKYLRYSIWVER